MIINSKTANFRRSEDGCYFWDGDLFANEDVTLEFDFPLFIAGDFTVTGSLHADLSMLAVGKCLKVTGDFTCTPLTLKMRDNTIETIPLMVQCGAKASIEGMVTDTIRIEEECYDEGSVKHLVAFSPFAANRIQNPFAYKIAKVMAATYDELRSETESIVRSIYPDLGPDVQYLSRYLLRMEIYAHAVSKNEDVKEPDAVLYFDFDCFTEAKTAIVDLVLDASPKIRTMFHDAQTINCSVSQIPIICTTAELVDTPFSKLNSCTEFDLQMKRQDETSTCGHRYFRQSDFFSNILSQQVFEWTHSIYEPIDVNSGGKQ